MRGLVVPALENIPTWQERDLTQSSAERFILPEACILTDYMLHTMIDVLSGLQVDEERMVKNLMLTEGLAMSEAVMMALAKKGMGRQDAHELVRRLTVQSTIEKIAFRDTLLQEKAVTNLLSEAEIDETLNPRNYLGTSVEQVEKAIEKTRKERRERGLS